MRREFLAGLCWPEASEASARRYLRQALWRIRRALPPAEASDSPWVVTDDIQVVFNPHSSYIVDTQVLEHREPGWEDIDALAHSAGQYLGDLLPGFYDDWITLQRERLRSIFEEKVALLIERLIQEERWREAVNWAEFWIARGGAPEPAFRALIRAYHGLGDRSGIVGAYQRCVEVLRAEVGVQPGKETTDLFQGLVGGAGTDLALHASASSPAQEWEMGGVPVPVTPIVNRVSELAQIDELLDAGECRLLTLAGLGGTGKTRLAIEVGLRRSGAHPGGVAFVSMAGLASGDLLAVSLARSLGSSLSGQRGYGEQIAEALGKRNILVILDGFDQTIDVAPLVAEILHRGPGVRFLVTSRERLNLRGEWVVEVRGLAVPESSDRESVEQSPAARLFLQTAKRLDHGYVPSDADIEAIAQFCQLTEGLPLAIELAGSWTRVLSCRQILEQMQENLGFLSAAERGIPDHQTSILATFEQSWSGLDNRERMAFRRLGVFRGGFHRSAALHVSEASLHVLLSLVDKSLVMRMSGDRFSLHALVAEFARTKLEEAGEADLIAKRHRDWYLDLVSASVPRLWGSGEIAYMDQLDADRDNLRSALTWSMEHGDADSRLRLASSLAWFWYVRGYYPEGRHWLEQALQASQGASALQLARVLYRSSLIASLQGDHDRAEALGLRALSVLSETDSPWDRAWALAGMGFAAELKEGYELAYKCFSDAEEVFAEENCPEEVITMRLYKGIACGRAGDCESAERVVRESLSRLRELNDTVALARGLLYLGELAVEREGLEEAAGHYSDALRYAKVRSSRDEIGQSLEGLAAVMLGTGHPLPAARLLGAADRIRSYLGSLRRSRFNQRAQDLLASAKRDLPAGAVDAAQLEGAAVSLEEAIESGVRCVSELGLPCAGDEPALHPGV